MKNFKNCIKFIKKVENEKNDQSAISDAGQKFYSYYNSKKLSEEDIEIIRNGKEIVENVVTIIEVKSNCSTISPLIGTLMSC